MLVLGVSVVLFGVPAMLSLLNAPELEQLTVKKVDGRTPASEGLPKQTKVDTVSVMTSSSHSHQKKGASTALVQYDCDGKNAQQEVSGNYVRLTGLPCEDFEDLEITNQTNGFSAAVIFMKGKKFTTDFIDLKEGENNLEITAKLTDGSRISQIFKVIRRVPAAVVN